jgi:branched-chain amino acid transport system ATP-binding protein
MVAIGRGLMAGPKLLMIDEPSLGLAPKVVERVVEVMAEINRNGTAMLLVEQDVMTALEAASRAYVLENGRIVLSRSSGELARDPDVRRAYLGI